MESDLIKRIEALEKELKSLKKDNLNMFGRSYSQVGSSNSDLVLKTRGQVKILYGSKYIDLIKDGKLNVDAKFIYKYDSVGSKDGIYLIGEGIVLVSGGQLVPLTSESGNTYVSFLGELETDSESKRLALINIGFLYPNIESVNETAIKNGIVYIESESKLYTIINGLLSEFKLSIPNPLTEPLVISNNSNYEGALVINGIGTENSIAFDSMYIYDLYIKSSLDLTISAKNIYLQGVLLFSEALITNEIKSSSNPNSSGGYSISINDSGLSVLNIDKVNERESDTSNLESWMTSSDLIISIETDDSGNIIIQLNNTWEVGNIFAYQDNGNTFLFSIEQIQEVDSLLLYFIKYLSDTSSEDFIELYSDDKVYLVGPNPVIRYKNGNIDLVDYVNNTILVSIGKLLDNTYGFYYDNLFPLNSIILYKGDEIPNGWKLCEDIPSNIEGINYIIKI